MSKIIREQALLIDDQKRTWEEAIRICGKLMVSLGSVEEGYIDAMVDVVNDMGPYIVIAPHIAFAHAAAGLHVIKNDLVLTVFKEPVIFNSNNDPVHLLFGICALAPESHLELLKKLAKVIEPEKVYQELINCNSTAEIYRIINGV
ncbi:MAG: PTS sugar transporter subunit IIA [Defluviitaleaceae bacterium]|nr:PTS sugar transporter subunit IIA [Defluviitaleaceae bacterium]